MSKVLAYALTAWFLVTSGGMLLAAEEKSVQLAESGEAKLGAPAPPFGGWSIRGRDVLSLDALLKSTAGGPTRAVLVSFFATWCKPCREGLPVVAAVAKELAPEGLRTVLVATGEGGDEVVKFLDGLGVDLPTLGDKFDAVSKRYGITQAAQGTSVSKQVPRTFVIDAQGNVRLIVSLEGADFRELLVQTIRALPQ